MALIRTCQLCTVFSVLIIVGRACVQKCTLLLDMYLIAILSALFIPVLTCVHLSSSVMARCHLSISVVSAESNQSSYVLDSFVPCAGGTLLATINSTIYTVAFTELTANSAMFNAIYLSSSSVKGRRLYSVCVCGGCIVCMCMWRLYSVYVEAV